MNLKQITVKIATEDGLNSQALEFLLKGDESEIIRTGIVNTEEVRRTIALLREKYFINYQNQTASILSGENPVSDIHRAKALVRTLDHFGDLDYNLSPELMGSDRLYVEII